MKPGDSRKHGQWLLTFVGKKDDRYTFTQSNAKTGELSETAPVVHLFGSTILALGLFTAED